MTQIICFYESTCVFWIIIKRMRLNVDQTQIIAVYYTQIRSLCKRTLFIYQLKDASVFTVWANKSHKRAAQSCPW